MYRFLEAGWRMWLKSLGGGRVRVCVYIRYGSVTTNEVFVLRASFIKS